MKKIHTFLCLIFMVLVTFQTYTQAPVKIWDRTIGGAGGFAAIDFAQSIIPTNDGGFIVAGYSDGTITSDKTENPKGSFDFWIVKLNSFGQRMWDKTIGGSADDRGRSIVTTDDGGYVIAGSSKSSTSFDKTENNRGVSTEYDYWIVKLNSSGQKVWDKTIGTNQDDQAYSVTKSSDGGFIIAGTSSGGILGDKTEASKGLKDYWIVKLNGLGQKVWDKTIGGNSDDEPRSIIPTSDGGFAIAGWSDSGISSDKSEASKGSTDYWIVKINSLGQKVWDKTIGGNSSDEAYAIIASSDGGFVATGLSFSDISGDKTEAVRNNSVDSWTVKLDNLGQKVWDKTIGGNDDDRAVSITSSSDGGFVIAINSSSDKSADKTELKRGLSDYWIVKLNSLGQKVWDKTVGGNSRDICSSITTSTDGNFVVAGRSNSPISGDKSEASKGQDDYWIVKLATIPTCPSFPNNIAYVNINATGANTGMNWANAFTSLESALSVARSRTCLITQIWVAKGTYKPSAYPTVLIGSPSLTNRDFTFEIVDGVGIYGGFVGTETALTQRVSGNTTILSGDIGTVGINTDNCYHVVFSFSNLPESNVRLDRLKIMDGNANGSSSVSGVFHNSGGGLYSYSSSPNITNVIFTGNSCSATGGGMYNDSNNSNSSILSNVVFSENSSQDGAGMYNRYCPSLNLSNVIFSNNTASRFGGGMYNFRSFPNLTNAVFLKNIASYTLDAGGALYNFESSMVMKNCILSKNQSSISNTIAHSDFSNEFGSTATYTISYTSMQLANNTTNYPTANFPNIGTSNNLFAQNPLFVNDTDPDGTDNIFMTTDDGLSLQSASPCKDAGTATGAPTTDIIGAARVGNVDMGAYEFSSSTLTTFDSATSGNWNATSTWVCSCIPNGTLPVRIMSNHIVTVPTTYIGQAKGLRFISTGKVTLQGTGKVNVIN
jgi:hypothetical protein